MNFTIDTRLFNPNYFHLEHHLKDPSISCIFLYGGTSSGKTFSVAQSLVLKIIDENVDIMITKKVAGRIPDTIYKDFINVINMFGLNRYFKIFKESILCKYNGKEIRFMGVPDSEKLKGLSPSYRYIVMDELSDYEIEDFLEMQTRMRKDNQTVICTFNPVSEDHWIKKQYFDKFDYEELPNTIDNNPFTKVKDIKRAMNDVWIRSTYLNNYWVNKSPDGSWGELQSQVIKKYEVLKKVDIKEYEVKALGQWGRITTGQEFYRNFKRDIHVKNPKVNLNEPLHISLDNNVNPFFPLVIMQTTPTSINVIDEITGKNPYNNAHAVAKMFIEKYEQFKVRKQTIFLYGDATARAKSTTHEKGYNVFKIIYDALTEAGFIVENRYGKSNPSVVQSGNFMNSILAGVQSRQLLFSESCENTIIDFQYLKQDKDGKILKEVARDKRAGTSYEKYGHCSDAVRYMVLTYLNDEYLDYIGEKDDIEVYDLYDYSKKRLIF